jgi:acyl CoA:acetate/3-ketoacid CoA transferase alpha subunit
MGMSFRYTAQNFGPVMAKNAKLTIVEVSSHIILLLILQKPRFYSCEG